MIPPDVFTVEEVKVEPYFDLRKIKTEIHPVNGIYVFVFTGLITIDASQLCFEPLVVNNQDNFEFQFSATQIQVKWSRPEVLLLLSLYRDRATVQGYKNQEQDLVGGSPKRYETATLRVYWLTM